MVVYLVMALALFSGEDYEEVVERLTGALRSWGSWDAGWEPATKGAVTQARQRLGAEPLAELFSRVAVPAGTRRLLFTGWRVRGPVQVPAGRR